MFFSWKGDEGVMHNQQLACSIKDMRAQSRANLLQSQIKFLTLWRNILCKFIVSETTQRPSRESSTCALLLLQTFLTMIILLLRFLELRALIKMSLGIYFFEKYQKVDSKALHYSNCLFLCNSGVHSELRCTKLLCGKGTRKQEGEKGKRSLKEIRFRLLIDF